MIAVRSAGLELHVEAWLPGLVVVDGFGIAESVEELRWADLPFEACAKA